MGVSINGRPVLPQNNVPLSQNDASLGGIPEKVKKKVIDELALKTARETLNKYIAGKESLDKRIIANEDWYKLQHWKNFHENRQDRMEQSTSAWLFNSILNKHADAMDNFPAPVVLPREKTDEATAKMLSSVLPVIFDNCDFEKTYSDNWWDKLKHGCSCYGVMWNQDLLNGQGDIDIRPVDLLSIYWEPGIQDIQDSKNIFVLQLQDNDSLERQYPELVGKLKSNNIDKKEYHFDENIDTSEKSVVVDWYYKIREQGQTYVHYVKYVGDTILFASENEEGYEGGIYDHGKYPFIMDVLYPEKGTPAGFGLIDTEKDAQEYIDRLGIAILLNAEEGAQRRYMIKDSAGVNEEELLDPHKRAIHVAGSPNEDNVRSFDTPVLPGTYLSVLQDKVNELKETSANRDFNQGGTSSGVTAASAITALQEAGNKTSRDIIKGSYRVYGEICKMAIELIRQFYDFKRTFRITGENGEPEFVEMDNTGLQSGQTSMYGMDFKTKEPIFDVEPHAQKQNPFTTYSQNQLALEFYDRGFFNPQLAEQALQCLDMMDFQGKEKVRQGIQNNSQLMQQLQQVQQIAALSAQALAEHGDPRVLQALQQMQGAGQGAGYDQSANQTVPVESRNQAERSRAVQPGE